MNTRLRQLLGLGAVVGALLLGGGAGGAAAAEAAEGATRSATVALGDATSARVEVALAAGRLRVTGGSRAGAGRPMPSGELLRGEFTFDDAAFGPTIAYEVAGAAGRLRLNQADLADLAPSGDEQESAWILFLNPMVPTDLKVELGAGESELTLGGLSLTGLEVVTGAGETTLDFSGDWRQDLAARVDNGAGELTLRLPRAVGVRVAVVQGAGDVEADGFREAPADVYVNDAYGAAEVTLDLAISHGAGDIELELVG